MTTGADLVRDRYCVCGCRQITAGIRPIMRCFAD